MESHIKILGFLYLFFHALQLFGGIIVMLVFFAGTAVFGIATSGSGHGMEGLAISPLTSALGFALGTCFIAVAIPGLIGGIGLLRGRRWARVLVIVLGALNLLNFPLGTALGIYTLWALLNTDSDQYFA